jgi:hypothetical protein
MKGTSSRTDKQKAVKAGVRQPGISRHATCHPSRHSIATHLLEDGYGIRTVQELWHSERRPVKAGVEASQASAVSSVERADYPRIYNKCQCNPGLVARPSAGVLSMSRESSYTVCISRRASRPHEKKFYAISAT